MIDCVSKVNSIHVFCDGSVRDDGRAGCGALMCEYDERANSCESTITFRLSDGVSSTQAELYAIYIVLTQVQGKHKDVHIFVDSRPALESLTSRSPVYEDLVAQCRSLMKEQQIKFYWIPSHVGILRMRRLMY